MVGAVAAAPTNCVDGEVVFHVRRTVFGCCDNISSEGLRVGFTSCIDSFFFCAERLGQFSSGCRHVGVNDALVHVRQMLKRNPADEIRMRVDICLIFRLCRAELWCCGKN